jgi:hypothetical protein
MCNKARVEGCIAKAFTCKEIMNFSTMYFSHANNVNAHMMRYRIVEEFPLSELKIFQMKGKGVGACTAHFVVDYEWNYTMLYMYTIMEEVEPYFDNFDKMYWKSLSNLQQSNWMTHMSMGKMMAQTSRSGFANM